jgi:hypothetical protein
MMNCFSFARVVYYIPRRKKNANNSSAEKVEFAEKIRVIMMTFQAEFMSSMVIFNLFKCFFFHPKVLEVLSFIHSFIHSEQEVERN